MRSADRENLVLLKHTVPKAGLYGRYFKRPLDIALASCAIVLLSPILLIVALLVRVKLGKPIIFRQERPGLDERVFTLYKFRTMTGEEDESGRLLPDEVRLTSFGRFLRATSLDELPELFNIVVGDMSIIGPRPQLVSDMLFMTPEQRQRHNVRPGLSGLAQINGRNCISWEDKLSYDLEYIKDITFLGDLKILLVTVKKVLDKNGISAEGFATAEDLGDYLLRVGRIDQKYYSCMQEKCSEIMTDR